MFLNIARQRMPNASPDFHQPQELIMSLKVQIFLSIDSNLQLNDLVVIADLVGPSPTQITQTSMVRPGKVFSFVSR